MLTKVRDFVDHYLLADRFKDDLYIVRKARLLVWIHLVLLFTAIILVIPTIWVQPALVPSISLFISITTGLVYVLKRKANMVLSGNLLVGLITIILLIDMLDTGGIYSDNLLWMILVPIVAFLFTSKKYGKIWSGVVFFVLTALFVLEVNAEASYRFKSLELGADYYFVSYLGLFSGLFGMILLFVKGNDDILEALQQKSVALKEQKKQAEAQNERLLEQEVLLTKSNKDLELFAYVASHDLKEPLRMVNAYTQILQRKLGPTLSLKDQEYMGYIREGAERMQIMLDDLLAFSRLGKERDQEKPVDLNDTLKIVKNNLKVRLEETGGEIVHEDLPTFSGKNTHYVQVFQNLIANSLKFHRENVPPRVVVSSSFNKDIDMYVITIEDNGIGMRQQDLKSIFGVFQRLHRSDKFEGSGIGLATVQRIIDGLQGKIEVSSELGIGSKFELYLPADLLVLDPKNFKVLAKDKALTAPEKKLNTNLPAS